MRLLRCVHVGFGDRLLGVLDLFWLSEQLQIALGEHDAEAGVMAHVVGLSALSIQHQLVVTKLTFAAQLVALACIEIEQEKALVVGVAEDLVIQINVHRVKAVEPTVTVDVNVGLSFGGG